MHAIILALVAVCASAESDGPGVHFVETRHDLGKVRGGMPLTHVFAFCNDGPMPVEILEVRHGCGCLTPHLDKTILPPGDKGSLKLTVRTLDQPAGPRRWHCQVRYRHGDQVREATLTLAAELYHEVSVRPAALTLLVDQEFRQEIILTDTRAETLLVTHVQTSGPLVRGHLLKQEAGKATIVLAADKNVPAGRYELVLDIFTSDPEYRHLQVPITVVRSERTSVSASPPQVTLRGRIGRPLPAAFVRLHARGDEKVAVAGIEVAHPGLKATWAPGPDNDATIKLMADAEQVTGPSLETRLIIHLASPRKETLIVPVSCSLQ